MVGAKTNTTALLLLLLLLLFMCGYFVEAGGRGGGVGPGAKTAAVQYRVQGRKIEFIFLFKS